MLLAITAMVYSCEKANHAAPATASNIQLSEAHYYYPDGSFYAVNYSYDAIGHLIKEEQLNAGQQPLFFRQYHYQENQLVNTQIGRDPKMAEFRHSYANQQLVKTEYEEFQFANAKQHFERIYEYQGTTLVKITQHDLVDDQHSSFSVFSYEGANISGIRNYNLKTGVLEEEVAFEYDNRKNPLYGVTLNTGNIRYASKNNLIRTKTSVENGHLVNKELVYEFEYNEQGYPTKSYQILENGARLPEAGFIYKTY
jgi:hypothetical protein